MNRLLPGLCALMLAACSSTSVPGSDVPDADLPRDQPDYPQFRGPKRNGISSSTDLLKEWPADGPKLDWKTTDLGMGYSSVAVAGKQVFTMGDRKGDCYLIAIDRQTGKKLWDLRVGKPGGSYAGPRSTPTVDGSCVYALGQFGDLVCVERDSGKELWRKSFTRDFKGRYGGWQYAESVLIDGDKLICAPGDPKATMVALNKKNGDVIWKCAIEQDKAAYSSVMIAEVNGIRQYVQLLANSLVGVSAKEGKLLWRYGNNYDHFKGNTANIPTVIVRDNYIFCSAGYGRGGGLIKLTESNGNFEVEEIYFKRELNNKHGGVILVGDYLYGDRDDSGRPWCAEFKTGKIRWQKKQRTKGRGSASLTYADGHLYVRYSNGYVALVKATPEAYEEVSTFKVPNGTGNCWAHPVVTNGRLYLREKDTLWCYNIKAR